MKKIYILIAGLGIALSSLAQVNTYTTNFDASTEEDFVSSDVLITGQNGSDFIIKSQGHGEWDGTGYTLNDGTDAVTLSMLSTDKIYVRAKAVFEGTINPVLSLQIFDSNGAGPNNDLYNAQNRMTLTDQYQVFEITVPDWTMTYGGPSDPVGTVADTADIVRLNLAVNSAFATFPSKNSEGEDINAAFTGTIYIDYLSIGATAVAGAELDVETEYSYTFDASILDDVTASESYVVDIVNDALEITSAGHDEWDIVNVAIPDAVADISGGLNLSFTASAELASGYTGPVGFMVTAVDETGTRIDYAGLYTVKNLSTTEETFVIELNQYINQGEFGSTEVNENRIASVDILINHGFASAPLTNDDAISVNEGFEGVIRISDISFTTQTVGLNDDVLSKSLSLYPNPASAQIHLEEVDGESYSISTIIGETIMSGTVTGGTIETADLDTGAYIITVTNDRGSVSKSFIKE